MACQAREYLKTWQAFSNCLSLIKFTDETLGNNIAELNAKKAAFVALVAQEPYKTIFQNSTEMQALKTKAAEAITTLNNFKTTFAAAYADIIADYTGE